MTSHVDFNPEQTRENVILAATTTAGSGRLNFYPKRVRRKRVRTSPLSGTARRMLVSHCSLAGPDDSPTLAPVPESTEEVSVPGEEDSGDVRTRFLRTRLARLGVEIKTPAPAVVVAAKMTFSLVCSGLKSTCDVTF